jgi:DNA (cytosine-5)-methyltransferase 1
MDFTLRPLPLSNKIQDSHGHLDFLDGPSLPTQVVHVQHQDDHESAVHLLVPMAAEKDNQKGLYREKAHVANSNASYIDITPKTTMDGDYLDAHSGDVVHIANSVTRDLIIELETTSKRPEGFTPESHSLVVALPQSTLTNPRSLYHSESTPAAPLISERKAVAALVDIVKRGTADKDCESGFFEFRLSEFSVYIDSAIYPNELRPLQHLAIRQASDQFYVDGLLSAGGTTFHVKRIPFRELPIGNYEVAKHAVYDQIWIRSTLNQGKEVYYKLGRPSTEYERFHTPFRWITNLAKHVIDYCEHLKSHGRRAILHDFRSRFNLFLLRKHKDSSEFQKWHLAHGRADFRVPIVANVDFIWKEAISVLGFGGAKWHLFWSDIRGERYRQTLRPAHSSLGKEDESSGFDDEPEGPKQKARKPETVQPTIVTPYIYDLFAHMGFGRLLKSTAPTAAVDKKRVDMMKTHIQLTKPEPEPQVVQNADLVPSELIASIQPGDVISTPPDGENTVTRWKMETSNHHKSDDVWYGLVQKVHISRRGGLRRRSFDVIWMYQPRDTPCALMKYPWRNELFLSDSCTCGRRNISENEILGKHQIEWYGTPWLTSAEFVVRQTYLAGERHWTSLTEDQKRCDHCERQPLKQPPPLYGPGDTVLARTNIHHCFLLVFEVERIFVDESGREMARVRKLPRRNDLDGVKNQPPNELVYCDDFVEIDTMKIARRCLVRCFRLDEKIPSPYDRSGTGDAFFITHREVRGEGQTTRYIPIDERHITFRQGFDPARIPRSEKLRGLDLYCGGGNFGRGLEDGGGITMKWANDINPNAIHTYMANCRPDSCTPFLGSVDDLLYGALMGDSNVPAPGDVQFISGGSPCQGFSRLTCDKTTDRQRKNQSLIASFASFIDLYRPCYGVLENVKSIVQGEENRRGCFFSQLICAIVGLGYQVQIVMMDAWSYGGPQSRERVFLVFTAPGLTMPKKPEPSHSHPPGTRLGTIGKMSNGEPYAKRVDLPTPFKFVSASEATADLPDVQDGKADYCIRFPDHRLSIGFTPRLRQQLAQIPIHPWGMSYRKMIPRYDEKGRHISGMTKAQHAYYFPGANTTKARYADTSQGLGRVDPTGLFRTVTTSCAIVDARTGIVNHWEQPRPLTVMEVRRAQGFLDHELILGSPANQWHIIGNSVSRQVALALGLAIREAWFGASSDEGGENNPEPSIIDLTSLDLGHLPVEETTDEHRLDMNMEVDEKLLNHAEPRSVSCSQARPLTHVPPATTVSTLPSEVGHVAIRPDSVSSESTMGAGSPLYIAPLPAESTPLTDDESDETVSTTSRKRHRDDISMWGKLVSAKRPRVEDGE